MTISKRLRYEILNRDGFACVYCGADAKQLHVDHVMPTALGGSDDPSNLVTSCQDCNLGKASSSPNAEQVAAVDARDIEWRKQVADALDSIAAEQHLENDLIDEVGKEWESWTWRDRGGNHRQFDRPPGWRNSVRLMLQRGFTPESLAACITIAMEAKPDDEWSYFCGIVWRTLKRAQGEDM